MHSGVQKNADIRTCEHSLKDPNTPDGPSTIPKNFDNCIRLVFLSFFSHDSFVLCVLRAKSFNVLTEGTSKLLPGHMSIIILKFAALVFILFIFGLAEIIYYRILFYVKHCKSFIVKIIKMKHSWIAVLSKNFGMFL